MLAQHVFPPAPEQSGGTVTRLWQEIQSLRRRYSATRGVGEEPERRRLCAAWCGLRQRMRCTGSTGWADIAAKIAAVLHELEEGHDADDWHRGMLRAALGELQELADHGPPLR